MLLGLALCGVGYSTNDLGLKKHNIMAKDKDRDKDKADRGCGVRAKVTDQGTTELNGTCRSEAPRRKLFKVSLLPYICH